ncbi:MAG TPA: ABC transporter permease [Anaerolineae bacterium]|nr:ABC transporter permease [Anaerolineae bacterium]
MEKTSGRARATRIAFVLYGVLGYGFLYLPVLLLALFSFNKSAAGNLPFTGFTLHWYADLFRDYLVMDAFKNSLLVAAVTALAATAIGTAAAFALVRARLRVTEFLRVIFVMPMMIPGLLIGIALLVFFSSMLNLPLSLGTVIVGHVVMTTPFVLLVVATRLTDFDRRLEWAAADLGANPLTTFRYIILPLILPGVLAGALFAFTLSLDEFVITLFTIGAQTTLPLYVFSQVKFGVTPKINALATLLLLGSITILMLTFYALSRVGRHGGSKHGGLGNRLRRVFGRSPRHATKTA